MSNYISTPVLKTALDQALVKYGNETCTILYERDGIFIKAVAPIENPESCESIVKVFNVPAKLNKAQNNIIKDKLLSEIEEATKEAQEMPLYTCMYCGEYSEDFYCSTDCKKADLLRIS